MNHLYAGHAILCIAAEKCLLHSERIKEDEQKSKKECKHHKINFSKWIYHIHFSIYLKGCTLQESPPSILIDHGNQFTNFKVMMKKKSNNIFLETELNYYI